MVVGQLELQIFAGMARLQSDMAQAQRTVSGAVTKINNVLGAIGVGISVDFLLGLTQKSNEYSKSISALSTQLGDATHQIKELDAASKSLSVQFGTPAIKQSAAFYEILSAGITDTTQATALLTEANRLAIGGNADLMVSVDGLTSIMKGYGGAAGTAAQIADTMFTASLAGKLSIQELSENIGKAVPLATTLGVSFEELTAGVSALTLGGISAKESVTGMRAILATVAKPSAEAAKLASDIGLQFNSAGIQAKGFAGFLEDVKQKTGGSADQLAILFGGVESLIPALALTGNAGKEFSNIMDQMATKAGAAETAFNKMADSPGFKFDKFMATMSSIAITLGDALANVLTPAAEMAANALNRLFGLNNASGMEKQVQLVNQLTEKVQSMANRTHVPLIGGLLFDKKEFDLLEHQLETAKADLAAMQKAQETTTGATSQDTTAQQANIEALEKKRLLMQQGTEVAKKYADPIIKLREEEAKLKELLSSNAITQEVYNKALQSTREQYERSLKLRKEQISDSQKFMSALIKEADQLGKTNSELKKMEAAKLGLSRQADSLIDRIERETKAERELKDAKERAKSITESVITKQEVYNRTLEELERIKPHLSVETYNRALKKAQDELNKTEKVTRSVTSEVDQLWIQAGRNIQSTLANSIFNFFDDGLKGMVKNVAIAVGRIASEFAALKIAQSIGLDRMFGMPGSSGSTAGKGFGFADIASLGGDAMNMFRSGGAGLTNMVSRAGSFLPGSAGTFFSSMGGTGAAAARGAMTLWGSSGLTGVSSAGASFGSAMGAAAGPLMANAIGISIGSMIAGNKKVGGLGGLETSLIGSAIGGPLGAVIGGSINALFGHGPLKFRQQSLQGNVSSSGFEGDITNVFRAKGGLLVGNKHKSFTEQLPVEVQDAFDTAIKGFYGSAHSFAENLGLDVKLVDGFTQELQIKSEKNQKLTEDAIAKMVDGIGNSLAQNVLPSVDNFRKAGENSFATLSRLNNEFVTLTQGAMNLGASAEYAKQLINSLSIDTRTAYLEYAGGSEKFLSDTESFAQNFLTEAERMAPLIKFVEDGLVSLGFSADMTREQFGDLVQTLLQSSSEADRATGALLLSNNQLASSVFSYKESIGEVASVTLIAAETIRSNANSNLGNLFSDLQKSVEEERKKITDKYNSKLSIVNTIIQGITGSIGKLKSFSDSLLSTINNLLPMGRDAAKDQIRSAIRTGNFDDDKLKLAIGALSDKSTTGFSSSFEFAREQAKSVSLLSDLKSAADTQMTDQQAFLSELNLQRGTLTSGFEQETLRLDSILDKAQKQIALLTGIDNGIKSLPEALRNFNLASLQGGGGAVTDPSTGLSPAASGNRNISNQAIIDYFNTPRTPEEIYRDAIANGVTSQQIINTGRFTEEEVEKFFRDTGIPRFASGGRHRGGLRIVGERGPEIERTGPSQITSNKDLKKSIGNDEVVSAVNKLVQRIDDLILGGATGPALRVKTI